MSSYQPGIPTGLVNLDTDYLNIQKNFQQLDTTFNVDHVTFSNQTAQNGYHKSIHFNPVSTTATNPPNNQPLSHVSVPPSLPPLTANYGQLFSAQVNDGINTDTALYFLTGADRLIQLTRNFAPVAANNGYTMLPGGLIMQWGIINGLVASTPTPVLFATANINFPTSCFNVQLSYISKAGGTGNVQTLSVTTATVSKFGFSYNSTQSTSAYVGFYWMAIGI